MTKENSSEIERGENGEIEKKIELEGSQKGPIWYSDSELGQLLHLQLPSEKENSNSGIYIWAEAASVQQLEQQIMYAVSVQSIEKSVISLIPLFLNAEENVFHEVGNHWAVLVLVGIPNQNEQIQTEKPRQIAIYQNPMGLEMPNSVKSHLKEWEVFDLQIKQQTNDNDSGPWVVYTAQNLVETLQESLPLFPGKEELQKSITSLYENQGEALRQFYHKRLEEKPQSSKVMNENSPLPLLLMNQNDQDDDGKDDVEVK